MFNIWLNKLYIVLCVNCTLQQNQQPSEVLDQQLKNEIQSFEKNQKNQSSLLNVTKQPSSFVSQKSTSFPMKTMNTSKLQYN